MKTPTDPSSKYDHVVVLMLENRSFDNLLGYLYEDGVPKGKSFEGLQDRTIKMPVPIYANGYQELPYIVPPNIPKMEDTAYDHEPLNGLQRSILLGASYVAQEHLKNNETDMPLVTEIQTVGGAVQYLNSIKELL